jgi:hypothetical protein
MLKRLLGWPFEGLHVLGMAIFFAVAAILTLLSAPGWLTKISRVSPDTASHQFREVGSIIGRHGWIVAAAALVGAIVAPYARGDGKKVLAWARVACAAAALVLVVLIWNASDPGSRMLDDVARWHSDRALTPFNGLLLATGLNLLLAAFVVGSAGGAKKAKPAAADKK